MLMRHLGGTWSDSFNRATQAIGRMTARSMGVMKDLPKSSMALMAPPSAPPVVARRAPLRDPVLAAGVRRHATRIAEEAGVDPPSGVRLWRGDALTGSGANGGLLLLSAPSGTSCGVAGFTTGRGIRARLEWDWDVGAFDVEVSDRGRQSKSRP